MKRNYQMLTEEEIESILQRYPEWQRIQNGNVSHFYLERKFSSFTDAFLFLTKLAFVSESLDHHAEIWNDYNLVRLTLYTHEVKGLTKTDEAFIEQSMKPNIVQA